MYAFTCETFTYASILLSTHTHMWNAYIDYILYEHEKHIQSYILIKCSITYMCEFWVVWVSVWKFHMWMCVCVSNVLVQRKSEIFPNPPTHAHFKSMIEANKVDSTDSVKEQGQYKLNRTVRNSKFPSTGLEHFQDYYTIVYVSNFQEFTHMDITSRLSQKWQTCY